MIKKYDILTEVFISHNFFSGDSLNIFDFEPSVECNKKMNKYGILFKKRKDSILLLYDTEKKYLLETEVTTSFSFFIYVNDRYFFDYSELPISTPGKYIYYFNSDNFTEDNCKKYLHKHNNVGLDNRMEHRSMKFKEFCSPNAKVELINRDQKVVFSGTGDTISDYTQVDISHFDEGVYVVRSGDKETKTYCSNKKKNKPLGVVDINNLNQQTFHILFKNRSTIWRYTIIPRDANYFQNLELSIINTSYQFYPKKSKIDDGKFIFVSEVEIPLKKEPLKNITLQKILTNNENETLISNLPSPGKDIVSSKTENGYFSDVIVYV